MISSKEYMMIHSPKLMKLLFDVYTKNIAYFQQQILLTERWSQYVLTIRTCIGQHYNDQTGRQIHQEIFRR